MEYTVKRLADLSGVSPRTLRYYDAAGLLRPARADGNGYRIYGTDEVDRLQQILFYRRLGFPLDEIGRILDEPGFDRSAALRGHLSALRKQKAQLESLIRTVEKTLACAKGEGTMSDSEKFEGFKKTLVEENERNYGAEVRARWGDAAADASNARVMGMSREQYGRSEALKGQIFELLRGAMASGDPAGPEARRLCEAHAEWLRLFWPEGAYTREAQASLAESYPADPRFRAYYEEGAGPGAADFMARAAAEYAKAE